MDQAHQVCQRILQSLVGLLIGDMWQVKRAYRTCISHSYRRWRWRTSLLGSKEALEQISHVGYEVIVVVVVVQSRSHVASPQYACQECGPSFLYWLLST
jgi:hypothetical protein